MVLPEKLQSSIKTIALCIGIVVDIIMGFICFKAQAPDLLSQIAFIAIAITIVLLIGITLQERAYPLWIGCVAIMFFFDTSYLLVSTDAQNNNLTAATDKVLLDLENDIKTAKLDKQRAQQIYDKALFDSNVSKTTQADINKQLEASIATLQLKEAQRNNRQAEVEAGKIMSSPITADKIFQAIPTAFAGGRWLQAIVYALISFIIQGMIWFALREGRQYEKLRLNSITASDGLGNVRDVGNTNVFPSGITERQYLAACWPEHERRIATHETVAKLRNWSVEEAREAEAKLFKNFNLIAIGLKLKLDPDITREQFLKKRRSTK